MYFDTHTHVNFSAFEGEVDQAIKRALDQDVWMTNIGTSYETSKSSAELVKNYDKGVYATIGLHPIHTWQDVKDEDEPLTKQEIFGEEKYQPLINDKVVAVGEIGLDYFRVQPENEQAIELQKKAFIDQLHFAQKNNLPVVIHCRDAYEDCLAILKAEYKGMGILHSFTGDWETAKKFLDIGFYIALNGILTFDKTGRLAEVCKNTPIDRLLSETDAPYLAPPPYRGKRNEPAYVKFVVDKMAEVRNMDRGELGQKTFQNALLVYNIKM